MAVSRVAQYLQRVASMGRSDALHSGRSCGLRLAEHGRAPPPHAGPVGDHEQGVDDPAEDNEVDDRFDECAEVDPLPVDGPAGRPSRPRRTDCVRRAG